VAVAVWGAPDANPWLGLVLECVSAQLGEPIPPPGLPGPFALADADELRTVFLGAGFVDVVVAEIAVPLRTVSFDDWWRRCVALAGPLARRIGAMDPGAVDAMRSAARRAAEPYTRDDGYEFPGLGLVASAARP
jgi:hypothetical protein